MWHQVQRRSSDVAGTRGFALPSAKIHYAPDRQATIDRVVIEIWFEDRPRIKGHVRIALVTLAETDRLELDAAELTILSITDDRGHALAYDRSGGRLIVRLQEKAPCGTALSLAIQYEGEPRRGLYFIGGNAFDPERPVEIWSQGQDEDNRHWFPCFDAPNQKAKTELIAHVGPGQLALSNGELVEQRDEGAGRVFHYRQETPHSTYLVSLVVGHYIAIERDGSVPVVSYVHPRDRARGELTFSRTAEMVRLFSELIGIPYPYPRYSQICVADFIFGGMENTSATTLTEMVLFDERNEADCRSPAEHLIAHELAHQWWGDLLTCTDWSHAWLNEGFATYFETIWSEHAESAADADYRRLLDQETYFEEKYRRPLVERSYEDPIDLFDSHLYEKGACVLHMIRRELGDDGFFRSLARYGAKHRGGSVETNDLRRTIEEVTGRNLEPLFDQWVYTAGHPELAVSGAWDAKQRIFDLTVEQKQAQPIFSFSVDVLVASRAGKEVHRVSIKDQKQTLHLPSRERPDVVIFDRGGAILKQVDNRLDSEILRAVCAHGEDLFATIDAVRTLVRRQEPAALAAVFGALKRHPFWAVRAEAAKALAKAPGSRTKTALVEAVAEDLDPRVRRAAIRALAAFKSDAAELAQLLNRRLESESSDYAIADAIRTIAELRAPSSPAFVRDALRMIGHNHCIRAAAVESLAQLRDLGALPEVYRLCGADQHTRVREAAIEAIGDLAAFAPEGSLPRIEAKDALLRMLDDPWPRARVRAAKALAHLGDRSTTGALKEHAEGELDGRGRRAMRIAARDLEEQGTMRQELDRMNGELETVRRSHAELLERMGKLEKRKKKR